MSKPTSDQLRATVEAYEKCGGDKTAAAKLLDIPTTTFRRWLEWASSQQDIKKLADKYTKTRTRMHIVIPDVQTKTGVANHHLEWVGNYIVEKQPDVLVCIGDWADMPSLSSYDKGKRSAENMRYQYDIEASKDSMEKLMTPLAKAGFYPEKHLTYGNHEQRIVRLSDDQPALHGKLGLEDLGFEEWGWQTHPFLEVIELDGVEYSHYFTSGAMGRPVSSAAALLRERQKSATMGHNQAFDFAVHKKTQNAALFCGCCYLHDEHYLGPQGNNYKRGIIVKHEVDNGRYDLMTVSLDFLKRHYS